MSDMDKFNIFQQKGCVKFFPIFKKTLAIAELNSIISAPTL
jgi:hypothetical protein